jgi:hypothetical protein
MVGLLFQGPARADWKVYGSADFGISSSSVDTDGNYGQGALAFKLKGVDEDSSPLVGGAFGLEIPMDEILPREWLLDVRLPDWPMRFEFEGAGLREYEFSTVGLGGDAFYSEVKVNTLFFNTWLDIPLISAYKPVQYLFGLGRQPRVRQWLEPMSWYMGVGVGVGFLDFKGTDNSLRLSDDIIDFAWNVGTGVNYDLTDRVTLSAGYRYVGVGDQEVDLLPIGVPDDPNAQLEFKQDIHEFRATVRVMLYDFLSPWR